MILHENHNLLIKIRYSKLAFHIRKKMFLPKNLNREFSCYKLLTNLNDLSSI